MRLSRKLPALPGAWTLDAGSWDWRTVTEKPDWSVDASHRNILCCSAFSATGRKGESCVEVVFGGADHGLKVYDGITGKFKRELYTKSSGHTEWVTAVAYLPDGRVVSGGMDSKLCLWEARSNRCRDILGHTASISDVSVSTSGRDSFALSASYDKTIRLWNLRTGKEVSLLRGHRSPVLRISWIYDALATASRDGEVRLWDLSRETCSATLKGHKDAISVITWLRVGREGTALASAGLDGSMRLWDPRQKREIARVRAHQGSVNLLTEVADAQAIFTGGADGRICLYEMRALETKANSVPRWISTEHE